jgi:chitinase
MFSRSITKWLMLSMVLTSAALAMMVRKPVISPVSAQANSQAAAESPEAEYKRVGYFVQWGRYSRNYHVKNIVTTDSADKLTHINYAFANISPGEPRCYEETRLGWGDAFADYEASYSDADSVDGKSDEFGQGLKGHFNQLKKLKGLYPKIKVLMAIGGYTWSGRFSDAALSQNRAAFVKSCIDLFIRGNLPVWAYVSGGTPSGGANNGKAAGVFDGIDLDWEFPAAPGFEGDPARDIPPNIYRHQDTENFTALLAEFRKQLDEVGKEHGKHYLLTIASPAGKSFYEKMELDKVAGIVDWINLMAYDFHGTWDAKGPTNFHAALYTSPDDPAASPNNISIDSVVTDYLKRGVPAKKLVLGIPFYGRGWTGVPNVNNGLYQSANTMVAAPARFEAGIEDYKVLAKLGYPEFRDPVTKAFWIFNGTTWWNYDDPEVIKLKMAYIKEKQLGGVMFWSIDGDDGTLIKAIDEGLK